jgi:hypothetical protein
MRGAFPAKGRRVLRLARIQIRRSRRSLRQLARRVRVAALMRSFRAQQVSARVSGQAFAHAARWSATIVAVLIFLPFVVIVQERIENE